MTTKVRISGNRFELDNLARSFKSEELYIERDDDNCYWLCSTKFDSMERSQVNKEAERIIYNLNGALKLVDAYAENITIDGVLYIDENGRRLMTYEFPLVQMTTGMRVYINSDVYKSDGSEIEDDNIESDIVTLVRASALSEAATKALRLVSKGLDDWASLYRLLEVVESDGVNIVKSGFASASNLSRFKQSANRPSISHDLARHGKDYPNSTPMKNPMDIPEARRFVLGIVKKWIDQIGG